jgi:hypothetical protein
MKIPDRNSLSARRKKVKKLPWVPLVRVLFLVLGLALLILAGVPIVDNVFGDNEPIRHIGEESVALDSQEPGTCIASVSTPQYRIPNPCEVQPAAWDFCAELTVDRIDPSAGTLIGQVSLSFPQQFASQLTDIHGNNVLEWNDATGDLVLQTQFVDPKSSFLVFRILGLDGRESVLASVPFEDHFAITPGAPAGIQIERGDGTCKGRYRFDVPIELPLTGSPQEYPHDQYTSFASLELVVPPALSLGVQTYDFGTLVPYTLHAAAGPALDNTSVRVFHNIEEIGYDPADVHVLNIQLVVSRDAQTKLFVYTVALVPIVLFLALVSILVQHRRRADNPLGSLIGFGAAFLSVLPLRQVLIPGEVAGLTRVDYVLAGQLALPVAALLLVRAIWWDFGMPGEKESGNAFGHESQGQVSRKHVAGDRPAPTDLPAPTPDNRSGGVEEGS